MHLNDVTVDRVSPKISPESVSIVTPLHVHLIQRLTSVANPYTGIATQVAAVLKESALLPLPKPKLERES
jgi:hypothetical protein